MYLCTVFNKVKAKIMNKAKDTRTFRQVWQSLDTVGKADLTKYMYEKAFVAAGTIYQWAAETRNPKAINRRMVVAGLKELFSINASAETLFPNR